MDELTGDHHQGKGADEGGGGFAAAWRWAGAGSGRGDDGFGDDGSAGAGWTAGRGRWDRGGRKRGGFGAAVQPLVEALDAVGGPEGVDDVMLSEFVVDLVRFRSMLDAVTASFVARWDARCLWADDGSRAARARLARDAGCNKRSTGRSVHTARSTRAMPLVAAAWREGTISTDHVERLTRACTPERATDFARLEAHLVTVAQDADWPVFERAVALFETASDDAGSDPTDPDDLDRRQRRERAHRNMRPVRVGDRWEIVGSLDKVGGQVVSDAWERITEELWQHDLSAARAACGPDASADEVTQAAVAMRTPAQRSADAFVEMATRAATAPVDGQRPRPLLSVVVSAGELFGPIREMFNGLVLSRLDVAQMLFEADFERIVFGPSGQPVDVSSPQRFFTGGWRRAVEVRDRVCQHPTCEVTAEHCQIDHIVEHTAGGQTSVDNGRLLCPKHNRQRPGRRQPPPSNRRSKRSTTGGDGSNAGSAHGDGDGDPDQPA